jgi:molybdate/tungstate transport system substrate-binding protein
MKRYPILIITILILIISTINGCIIIEESNNTLSIFHAGSLSGPFRELEAEFEKNNENLDVQRESAGSVDTIRKVTDLDKVADIVASADYALISSMMINNEPVYADWYIQFALNQLVIAYTDKSTDHDIITGNNWPTLFARDDINFGFSNPNTDPCGYRALMMLQLAEKYYNITNLFEDLIQSHSSISATQSGENYTIKAPESLSPDSSIMIRPKETDLMAQLEASELDYLIIYRSVAYQHREAGVKFLELPNAIDLSEASLADEYKRVSLQQYSDKSGNGKMITAKPIVYGITIPTNANHPEEAEKFIELLLGTKGQQVFTDLGQPPIIPARASNLDKLPESLKSLVIQE